MELTDGRVIVRHADQLRERHSVVPRVANDPFRSRVMPIPVPVPVSEGAAASARHASVPGQQASAPDRPPAPAPPGPAGAVAAPGVPTVPPSAPSPGAPR